MSILKKSPAEFRVPSLSEADEAYAALAARMAEISASLTGLRREEAALETAVRNDRGAPRPMASDVAKLLGDAVDNAPAERAKRLAEVRREISTHERAIQVARERLATAKGAASVKVCDAVRPEYGRRVKALITALEAAAAAREDYERLCDELAGADVEWTRLGVFRPNFLGDRRDGHVQRLAREAREAGYVG